MSIVLSIDEILAIIHPTFDNNDVIYDFIYYSLRLISSTIKG
jgi:hypothetical protein